jgi:hypothetical protein
MLVIRINRYLLRSRSSASAFGRHAAGDPRLVAQLRAGRQPRPALRRRIEAYLDAAEIRLEERKKCRRR